jgi:tetratricopeptide (TPR) repeat protein
VHGNRLPAAAGLCVLTALLAGCAGQVAGPAHPAWSPDLLSGERLFGEPVDPALAPDAEIAVADEQMRASVARWLGDAEVPLTRFRLLMQGLTIDGYFAADRYDPNRTLTAAEAFRAQAGNCLSYTNMFVALAREAGLDAVYQVVDVPPSWGVDSGFLLRYTHVNVLLRGVRIRPTQDALVTVDFNDVQPDPEHGRRLVSDEYARALFYGNLAMDLLVEGELKESFALLRRAIEIEPRNADFWVNLGALYRTRADFTSAIEAFGVALKLDPRNRTAIAGLARSHADAGHAELAAEYEARARDYLEENPWYHLAIAQEAYVRGEDARALAAVERAVRLKPRSGRMHFMKALVLERQGDLEAAMESYRLARRYGVENADKRDKLARTLGANGSGPLPVGRDPRFGE